MDFIHDEDLTVLDIVGDKTIKDFYEYLMAEYWNLKENGHAIEFYKFSHELAATALAMYDFAAHINSGD